MAQQHDPRQSPLLLAPAARQHAADEPPQPSERHVGPLEAVRFVPRGAELGLGPAVAPEEARALLPGPRALPVRPRGGHALLRAPRRDRGRVPLHVGRSAPPQAGRRAARSAVAARRPRAAAPLARATAATVGDRAVAPYLIIIHPRTERSLPCAVSSCRSPCCAPRPRVAVRSATRRERTA